MVTEGRREELGFKHAELEESIGPVRTPCGDSDGQLDFKGKQIRENDIWICVWVKQCKHYL